jgi:hypothetical protein
MSLELIDNTRFIVEQTITQMSKNSLTFWLRKSWNSFLISTYLYLPPFFILLFDSKIAAMLSCIHQPATAKEWVTVSRNLISLRSIGIFWGIQIIWFYFSVASPILFVMDNEAHSYIAFTALMERLKENFSITGTTMTLK